MIKILRWFFDKCAYKKIWNAGVICYRYFSIISLLDHFVDIYFGCNKENLLVVMKLVKNNKSVRMNNVDCGNWAVTKEMPPCWQLNKWNSWTVIWKTNAFLYYITCTTMSNQQLLERKNRHRNTSQNPEKYYYKSFEDDYHVHIFWIPIIYT